MITIISYSNSIAQLLQANPVSDDEGEEESMAASVYIPEQGEASEEKPGQVKAARKSPPKKRPQHLRVQQLTPTKPVRATPKVASPPVDAYIPDSPASSGYSDMSAPSTPGSPGTPRMEQPPMIGPMQLPPGFAMVQGQVQQLQQQAQPQQQQQQQGVYRQLFEGDRVDARVEANADGVAVQVRADRARLEAGELTFYQKRF